MVNAHEGVGSLVVLAYLFLVIMNLITLFSGREFGWLRPVSMLAALLLLIQYILGFTLLGQNHHITPAHYIIALLAILTVGLEHGYANQRPIERDRATMRTVANVATLILVVVAYIIGRANA